MHHFAPYFAPYYLKEMGTSYTYTFICIVPLLTGHHVVLLLYVCLTFCWGLSLNIGSSITIWLCNIAMENGPFIDDLPIKHGDFPWRC